MAFAKHTQSGLTYELMRFPSWGAKFVESGAMSPSNAIDSFTHLLNRYGVLGETDLGIPNLVRPPRLLFGGLVSMRFSTSLSDSFLFGFGVVFSKHRIFCSEATDFVIRTCVTAHAAFVSVVAELGRLIFDDEQAFFFTGIGKMRRLIQTDGDECSRTVFTDSSIPFRVQLVRQLKVFLEPVVHGFMGVADVDLAVDGVRYLIDGVDFHGFCSYILIR